MTNYEVEGFKCDPIWGIYISVNATEAFELGIITEEQMRSFKYAYGNERLEFVIKKEDEHPLLRARLRNMRIPYDIHEEVPSTEKILGMLHDLYKWRPEAGAYVASHIPGAILYAGWADDEDESWQKDYSWDFAREACMDIKVVVPQIGYFPERTFLVKQ